MQSLELTNTLTGNKERFEPLKTGVVNLYVCGITPYDFAHVGHGRCYVTYDVLYRLLKFLNYQVTYVRNFTDIDDKLLARANKEFGDRHRYTEVADRYIQAFGQDMAALAVLTPDKEPRVTTHIPQIITFIQGLIDAGKAYVSNGDVYYSIKSFPEYGKLSHRNLDDLKAGARVQVSELKRDPLDFALWKSEPEGEFWQSPWGWGRPGWHIECSVLSTTYLGPHLDIHAGGMDLIFPHHENEIAQSEGLLGAPFSKYWLHNAFVRIDKEKMSKSLGNFFTLRDIFAKVDPMVLRFYFLNHQYRAPLDFSLHELEVITKAYQKLANAFVDVAVTDDVEKIKSSPTVQKMLSFVLDDLNTPGMLGVVFESLPMLKENPQEAQAVKSFFVHVLGLSLVPLAEKEVEITPEIQKLLDERQAARAAKNWARADEIRDQLQAMGVTVADIKSS